uniref:CA domain-containing protein n=1 Tax=Macrostomum lignano TaxID=282301 RepID=A0A1I8FQ02_9PLAT
LSLAAGLNASLKSVYRLQATARDQGSPSLSARRNVTVYVNATNVYTPVFSPAVYTVVVNETASTGVVIATVSATDADYPVFGAPADAHFDIDATSGAIRLKLALDFETSQSHELVAVATTAARDGPPQPPPEVFLAPSNASASWQFGFVSLSIPTIDGGAAAAGHLLGDCWSSLVRIDSIQRLAELAQRLSSDCWKPLSNVAAVDAARLFSDCSTGSPAGRGVLRQGAFFAGVSALSVPSAGEPNDWLTVANVDAKINGGAADAGSPIGCRPVATSLTSRRIRRQRSEPKYSASVLISLPLTDINDNPPRFQFPARLLVPGECHHWLRSSSRRGCGSRRFGRRDPAAKRWPVYASNYSLPLRIGDVNDNPPKFAPRRSISRSTEQVHRCARCRPALSGHDPDTAARRSEARRWPSSCLPCGPAACVPPPTLRCRLQQRRRVDTRTFCTAGVSRRPSMFTGEAHAVAQVTAVEHPGREQSRPRISQTCPALGASPENSSIGSGQDLDAGQNANVSLTLVSGNEPRLRFSIVGRFQADGLPSQHRSRGTRSRLRLCGNGRVLLVAHATDAVADAAQLTGILTV